MELGGSIDNSDKRSKQYVQTSRNVGQRQQGFNTSRSGCFPDGASITFSCLVGGKLAVSIVTSSSREGERHCRCVATASLNQGSIYAFMFLLGMNKGGGKSGPTFLSRNPSLLGMLA
jgi:hypothetical protein